MKDYLISMFVDNELDLDEKIEFVETVHSNKPFKNEAIELLDQEKLLQGDMVTAMPEIKMKNQFIPTLVCTIHRICYCYNCSGSFLFVASGSSDH